MAGEQFVGKPNHSRVSDLQRVRPIFIQGIRRIFKLFRDDRPIRLFVQTRQRIAKPNIGY